MSNNTLFFFFNIMEMYLKNNEKDRYIKETMFSVILHNGVRFHLQIHNYT